MISSGSVAFLERSHDDDFEEKIIADAECFHSQPSSSGDPYVNIQLTNGCKLQLGVEYDYLDSSTNENDCGEKWNVLNTEEVKECMHVTFKELNQDLTGMIPCLRCRSCVKNVMRRAAPNCKDDEQRLYDQQIYPLCWHGPSCVSLHQRFLSEPHSSATYNLVNDHSYLLAEKKSWKAKQALCRFHKKRQQKMDCAWIDLWDNLNDEQRGKMTQLQRIPFEKRLKRYVDCEDCHKHVFAAYVLISSLSDDVEYQWDESHLEKTEGFSLRVTNQKIFLPMKLKHITNLMSKAEDEVNWEAPKDHTRGWKRSLHTIQVVLGMMLWEQFESLWSQLRREAHSMECFVRVCLKSFQKKVEVKIHEQEGEAHLKALIDSLENEKATENIKKKKKRRRKKRQRNKTVEKKLDNVPRTDPNTCKRCGETESRVIELQFNESEILFLETLGWSEKNRNAWEAEPFANEEGAMENIVQERKRCQQCLLNSWFNFCDMRMLG